MSRAQWATMAAVVVVVIAAVFLRSALEPKPVGTQTLTKDTVDYSMEELRAIVFGDDGQPRYFLHAPRLQHFAQTEQVEISQPELRFVGQTEVEWHAQARTALVDDGGDNILLRGEVVADRTGHAPEDALSLQTDELTLMPQSKRAETAARVEIRSPTHSITATGLRADLDQRQFEFLADVHGIYGGGAR